MARKRKAGGLGSVLSSLPQEVRLAFTPSAISNTAAVEEELQDTSSSCTSDLIVQRVHVSRSTASATPVATEESSVDAPTPARKKQRLSEPPTSNAPSVSFGIPTTAVLHYKSQKSVPQHLKKYFAQRHRFFSLYDQGCLLDEEGWYSVTPEKIALQIAERCRCDTVVDAFCGVGGNAIAFAQTCERVIALDISPTRLAIAKHNAQIYGVADRIEFILCDYLSFARSLASTGRRVDVVFLSPPWGGPSYISGTTDTQESSTSEVQSAVYSLNSLLPVSGTELFSLSHKLSRNIALYLPRNTDVGEIGSLAPPGELVEIEEAWMGSKLKALTCYFGGLARGQGHLFDV